jgi:hypothetical protein
MANSDLKYTVLSIQQSLSRIFYSEDLHLFMLTPKNSPQSRNTNR